MNNRLIAGLVAIFAAFSCGSEGSTETTTRNQALIVCHCQQEEFDPKGNLTSSTEYSVDDESIYYDPIDCTSEEHTHASGAVTTWDCEPA